MSTVNEWIQHVGVGILITIIVAIFAHMTVTHFIAFCVVGVIGAKIGSDLARRRT